MSSIGGIVGNTTMHTPAQFRSLRRPDPEQMASKAFAQIDTTSRGYIEKSDLQSAMDRTSSTGSTTTTTTTSADDLFAKLDGDGDGKVTKQEFTSGVTSLADELRQHGGMGAMGGMPPGPPPGGGADGAGFTKEELASQLDGIGSSGDPRSKLLSSLVDNFDSADGDGDGKVSFSEARTFAASQTNGSATSGGSSGGTTASSSGTGSASSSTAASDLTAGLAQQMMRLLHSYAVASTADSASSLSLSA